MKKILLPLLMAGICSAPALAQAVTPYVSASAGVALLNNSKINGIEDSAEYNSGLALNGAIGLESDMGRLEAAVGYQKNDVDNVFGFTNLGDSHVRIGSLMANGYLDYNKKHCDISPYIMAGAGVADVKADVYDSFGTFYSDSDTVFAWQVGAGVGIKASKNLTLDIGYRYFSPNDANLDGYKVSLASSNILAGLRYSF
jgi:opacity protein-like surface antigen